MYISNLIYKCYKWEFILMNAVPFSFKQMKEKLSLICKQNLWTRTRHMKNRPWDLLWESFLLLNFSINCPVLYDFIHVYSFFFFMLLYFRGFLQYCIHILFFFHCLVIVPIVYTVCLKEMTLIVLPSGTFSPVYIMLYVIVINTYVICTWLKRSL